MAKRFRKIIHKFGDIIGVVGILFFDLITAIFYIACLYLPFNHYRTFFYWAFRIYLILIIVLIILGEIHYFRWFVMDGKQKINCHHCGKKVTAIRKEIWNQNEYPPVDFLYPINGYKRMIHLQTRRPVLFYTCPDCGATEYICPYCLKPVGQNDEECPHCKKRMVRNTRI